MIYFDNAATSRFKPDSMITEMCSTLKFSSNFSRASHSDAIETATKIELLKEHIRSYLSIPSKYEIIFSSSCTESLNQAILGFGISQKSQFHIITTAFDHNSTLRPIHHLAKINKARYTIIKPNEHLEIDTHQLENAISPQTKLIVINHMSNVTGSIINLDKIKEISKKHNTVLVMDSAQSIGHIKIDIDGIDFLAAPGHKGLHGPQGVGFLIANKNINLSPIIFGGTGIHSESLEQESVYPESFEVGTLNAPGLIGLNESFLYTMNNFKLINDKISCLSAYLYRKLLDINNIQIFSKPSSPVMSIQYKNYSSSRLSDYLNENNIATRAGLHCAPMIHSYFNTIKTGLTRISIGYNNTLDEIDYLVEVLTRLNRIY